MKDFFSDGTPKSVTRLNPDGSLLGTLYYSNGVPNHADYFDEQKRVRRTLLYRADGTAQTSRDFDEGGKLVAEQQLEGIQRYREIQSLHCISRRCRGDSFRSVQIAA
ncbi:MAG TPA: hypothetical protein VFA77_15455 [Candidatus Eisenbacteria bacterium]|nr:hypothetical protein [Candidatus Eisenbacteria bacterium]